MHFHSRHTRRCTPRFTGTHLHQTHPTYEYIPHSWPPRSKCPKGVCPRLLLWLLGRLAGLGCAPGVFLLCLPPCPHTAIPLCPADNLKKRIANINHYLTYNLYSNVCRSLFEKHKLMFAFLLCARIMMNQGKINQVRGREGATARSRTDGLRGCPVAKLTEQGGRTGHIRQEGTARAGGQRPLETSGRRAQQGQMGRGLRKHQAGGHSKGRWSEASGNSYLRETPGGPG